jgi:hypothetical protein
MNGACDRLQKNTYLCRTLFFMKKKRGQNRQPLLLLLTILVSTGAALAQDAPAMVEPLADTAAIRRAVVRQMQRYPESRLADIYKNFFQDYFGPGHLLKDTAAAERYLQQELALCGECTGEWAEATGAEGRFYRIDLCAVKENRITAADLLRAFIESANRTVPPPPEAWIAIWNQITRILDAMSLAIPDYDADKAALQAMLQSGHYAVHHSDAYNRCYRPHYRILRKEIMEQLEIKN